MCEAAVTRLVPVGMRVSLLFIVTTALGVIHGG
jgi:hypothetical protein